MSRAKFRDKLPVFLLLAVELRTAFCDEGGYSFLGVVALTGFNDRFLFGIELIRQAGFE
jgi:hypothetical protein